MAVKRFKLYILYIQIKSTFLCDYAQLKLWTLLCDKGTHTNQIDKHAVMFHQVTKKFQQFLPQHVQAI